MTTPFWQHRRRSFVNISDLRDLDTEKCIIDWKRFFNKIYINGKSLSKIVDRPGKINAQSLEGIWRQLIPGGIDEEYQNQFIKQCSKIFTQAGIMFLTENSMILTAGSKFYGPPTPDDVVSKMNFRVVGDELLIEDEVGIKKLRETGQGGRHTQNIIEPPDGQEYIVSGKSRITVTFDENRDNNSKFTICDNFELTDLVIDYSNDAAREAIDTRTVFEKIKDFFKSILRMNDFPEIEDNNKVSLM